MLLLDNRIGSKHLYHRLSDRIPVSLEKLEFGDAAFRSADEKQIGIEIKTIDEILADFSNNRFTGFQIPGLIDTYDTVYLAIQGIWKCSAYGRVLIFKGSWREPLYPPGGTGYGTVVKRLNSFMLLGNLRLFYPNGDKETAEWLIALYQWYQIKLRQHTSLSTFYVKPPTGVTFKVPSLFQQMIKPIPGLGWKKTDALGSSFGTMEQLLRASEPELAEVEGIGPVLAKEIYRSLRV